MDAARPVFSGYQPPQALLVQRNPNLDKTWELGFGNRALPFVDAAAREKIFNLNVSVVTPFFRAANDLQIFDGCKYVCASSASADQVTSCFQNVFYMHPYACADDYLRIFKSYSSVAIVEPFPTNDKFDESNWRAAATRYGLHQRPGGVYRPFDLNDRVQMQFTNACLQLKSDIPVQEITFDEDCTRVSLFLRLGRLVQDLLNSVREEYPAKFFSDRELGIPSGDLAAEEFRMSPTLIVKTLEEILRDKDAFGTRKLHVQITSDLSEDQLQLNKVADWFQKQFDERQIKFSFEPSASIWRDLYGAKHVDIMIGGSSDFLRVAAARNLEGVRQNPLYVFAPKPDVTRRSLFLQPNTQEMEHIVVNDGENSVQAGVSKVGNQAVSSINKLR